MCLLNLISTKTLAFRLTIVCLSLCCSTASATTFYVSNEGNDSNPGTSIDSPWQTLAHVNGQTFAPDDVILLRSGDIFRETLIPPSSGSSGHPIIISEYGTGGKPIVTGGDAINSFTQVSTNIWTASLPIRPNVVSVSGVLAAPVLTESQLSVPGQWTWHDGLLSVYSAGQPNSIEAAQRDYAVLIGQFGGGSFTSITGVDFRLANVDAAHIVNTTGDTIRGCVAKFAYQFGVFAIGVDQQSISDLTIVDSEVSWNGSSGIEISSGHNHIRITGNTVELNAYNLANVENFQFTAGIYLYSNVPGTATYDLIENNTVRNNGVAGGTESQGSGIWADTIGESRVISNVSEGNAAHGIFLEKTTNCKMADNLAVGNGSAANSANLTLYASYGVNAISNTVVRNISLKSRGLGIKLGAYEGGGSTLFSSNLIAYNKASNSQIVDLYIGQGADNDVTDGTGNTYIGNQFTTQAGFGTIPQ